jgi:hypothetical protein
MLVYCNSIAIRTSMYDLYYLQYIRIKINDGGRRRDRIPRTPVYVNAPHVCVWMCASPGMYRDLYLHMDMVNEGGNNL